MTRFSIRVDNLEARSCNASLCSGGVHTRAEIVKWHEQDRACHTVACWENGDLHFVGDRPFEVDMITFWEIAEFVQSTMLDRLGNED